MTTAERLHTAEGLQELADWIETTFLRTWGLDGCVIAVAMVVDYLAGYGIEARPVAVRALIHRPGYVPPEGGTYGIVLGGQEPPPGVTETRGPPTTSPWSWRGHLVALTKGFLIDPTLGQVSHPEHGIPLGALVAPFPRAFGFLRGDIQAVLKVEGGIEIRYQPDLGNTQWQDSPDWTGPSRALTTSMLITAYSNHRGAGYERKRREKRQ